jgi:hypothetical protein
MRVLDPGRREVGSAGQGSDSGVILRLSKGER